MQYQPQACEQPKRQYQPPSNWIMTLIVVVSKECLVVATGHLSSHKTNHHHNDLLRLRILALPFRVFAIPIEICF
jgi:hypothetical protein